MPYHTRTRLLVASSLVLGALAWSARPAMAQSPKPRNVAVLVYNGVELLDFAGPTEAFSQARDAESLFNVYLVAPRKGDVVTGQRVTLNVAYSIDDCPAPDILVIPGGSTQAIITDAKVKSWIRAVDAKNEVTMSVCNGAFVLADLGLLENQDATTYWAFVQTLQRQVPNARVHADARVCDNGHIVTTAGISAGIDGSLALIERLHGSEIAYDAARSMEYDWRPAPIATDAPDASARSLRREAARAYSLRQWDVALRAYQELATLLPTDARVASQLGNTLMNAGKESQGLIELQRASAIAPTDGVIAERVARALLGAGRYEEAATAYDRAVTLGQKGFTTTYNRACALSRVGKLDAAVGVLREGIASWPYDPSQILTDEDLVPLHGHEPFRALMRDLARQGGGGAGGPLRIASREEPGERIRINGIVVDSADHPVADAIVAVYHTDNAGAYAPTDQPGHMDEPHARLFGFVKTDSAGRFSIATIRPGGYPNPIKLDGTERLLPAHVHLDVEAAGMQTLRKQLVFADDPRMDDHWKKWARDLQQPVVVPGPVVGGVRVCEVTLRLTAGAQ